MIVIVYAAQFDKSDDYCVRNIELTYNEFKKLDSLESIINYIKDKVQIENYIVLLNILRIGD